jgi:GNAT superfamily N-acetyltransferase
VDVRIAESDEQIGACWAVMHELRPHVDRASFVGRVRRQERQSGYRLAYRAEDGRPVAVAGFRLLENLAWGRFLYVDDLVTAGAARSKGHGAALLGWLRAHARSLGCDALHLDSGVQRIDAHRFYEREGMARSSYHFMIKIE